MIPEKKGDHVELTCKKCGRSQKVYDYDKHVERFKDPEKLDIVDADHDIHLPTKELECEKCGNKCAYYWQVQMLPSDEPPTHFYRCTSCHHTWREWWY